MMVNCRREAPANPIKVDVCVVGGGVAGITLARELAGRELSVCVLESGERKPDKNTQRLCEGEIAGLPYYPLDTARSRQFGGSSNRWLLELGDGRTGARLRPLDPIDFEKRDWIPDSGWPFGRADLDPYYARAQRLCGAGPLLYDDALSPTLPLAGAEVNEAVYQFVSRDVFTGIAREELEHADNVTVYLNATTLGVESGEDGRVRHIRAVAPDGKPFEVIAKVYVLALGGIETPRLMLLSPGGHGSGLGNQHDLVGRYFMEHPHLWSGYWVPARRSLFNETALYRIHFHDGYPLLRQLSLSAEVLRRERMLNYSVHLVPGIRKRAGLRHSLNRGANTLSQLRAAIINRDLNDFNRHLSTLFPVVSEASIAAYRKAAWAFNKVVGKKRNFEVFRLNHMAEQSPNAGSRVSLSDEKDRFGQNKAKLEWRLSKADIQSIVKAQVILGETLRKSGLGELEIELEGYDIPTDIHGGWHHMGTTRMHQSPRHGVVDENCRVHGTKNLFIAGPSVFPTSGYANPVLTIMALAVRLADHIKSRTQPLSGGQPARLAEGPLN